MEMRRQLVGVSNAIREIQQEVECAGRTDAKTLITGESGVGKEVIANLIHHESRRRFAPFVAINCSGVPDSLLESELFGHVRGSFTDAHRDQKGWLDQANRGTIFLDEVGEMSARMQAVLLRFLESGEIQRVGANRPETIADVRIVAATNRDLLQRIADKQFREDLYYRLNVIRIVVPPLRDRKEDVLPLLHHFLRMASETHHVPLPRLSDEAVERLLQHSWPGNARELKNVAERLVVRARTGLVPASDLPSEISAVQMASARPIAIPVTTGTALDQVYDRMASGGESFWTVVAEPFLARDFTRDDIRGIVSRGLVETRGSYKQLLQLFNMGPDDYKKFLSFLRKYSCHMPFRKFRSIPVAPETLTTHRAGMIARTLDKTG